MGRLPLAALVLLWALHAGAELPFVENDFARAKARAVAANVPLFIEAWAPW